MAGNTKNTITKTNCLRSLYFLVCFLFFTHNVYGQYVLYGERIENSNILTLFFDREGTIYPEYYISDSSLMKSGASLSEWYQDNPAEFLNICGQYGVQADKVSIANIALLQNSLIANFISKIKSNQDTGSLTFLVHGYRKPYKENKHDHTSVKEYSEFEKSFMKHATQHTRFVEIYWDGCYDCCFGSNFIKNKHLFRLFETAQLHAQKVGCNLRDVLSRIETKQINVLSHSLGAMVVVQSLFNYKDCGNKTPSVPKVNVCLLAPAIAGLDVFKKYYDRVSSVDYLKYDNYRLAIAYNTNDFVLKKKVRKLGIKLGPGPYKYGITTLGCNCDNDAANLKQYINDHYSSSYFELIDLSEAGVCHYLGNDCYSKGDILEKVVRFFEK